MVTIWPFTDRKSLAFTAIVSTELMQLKYYSKIKPFFPLFLSLDMFIFTRVMKSIVYRRH